MFESTKFPNLAFSHRPHSRLCWREEGRMRVALAATGECSHGRPCMCIDCYFISQISHFIQHFPLSKMVNNQFKVKKKNKTFFRETSNRGWACADDNFFLSVRKWQTQIRWRTLIWSIESCQAWILLCQPCSQVSFRLMQVFCLVVVRRAVCSLIPRASRLCLEAFRFMTTCLLVLYQAFRPSHPVLIVLSTPKCLASCKLFQFNDNAVSLLPSQLKFVQSWGSVSVSGLGVIKRARSEFPTRRPGSSNANNAAGTSSTVYMIPKLSKAVQSTPDDVKGFSSDNDLATID